MAVESAAVSESTLRSELEPSFSDRMPSRSVRELMSLDSFENSVPMLEMTVSWLCKEVSWVFQGVSTFWRLLTIEATVELTSNPAPLVGEPKFSPTVPIARSRGN